MVPDHVIDVSRNVPSRRDFRDQIRAGVDLRWWPNNLRETLMLDSDRVVIIGGPPTNGCLRTASATFAERASVSAGSR